MEKNSPAQSFKDDEASSSLGEPTTPQTSVTKEQPKETTTQNVQPAAAPIEDLAAWLQVLGSFLLFFNTWGFLNAFGDYFVFYSATLLPNYSQSSLSWIGSIQGFLLIFFGVLTGPIFDFGYFRTMLAVGSVMFVFGLMMLSLATEYYQVMLAQGVCIGLASGLLYVPSLALVASSFTKRRGLAIGLSTSGSSVGGVIYPIMFRQLLPQIGFGWTTRAIGLVAGVAFLLSWTIMLPRKPKYTDKARQIFDFKALSEIPFLAFTLGGFFIFLAFYVPYFYVSLFAADVLRTSLQTASYVLAVSNAAAFFGRISASALTDYVQPALVLTIAAAASALLIFCWIAVHSIAGLYVWVVIWGFISGIQVSVPVAVVPHLCKSLTQYGSRLGLAWAGAAVGILVGNPIAGALTTSTLSHFSHAQIFAGAVMVTGACFQVVPAYSIARRKRAAAASLA